MLKSVAKSRLAEGCTNKHKTHLRRDGHLASFSQRRHLPEVPALGVPHHEGIIGPRIDVQVPHFEQQSR